MNRWRTKLVTVALLIVMSAMFSPQRGSAQGGQPLPPLPNRAIVDKVIKETGGATFKPLGMPTVLPGMLFNIATALLPANGLTADAVFDLPRAVYYITITDSSAENKNGMQRVVIPAVSTLPLQPDITTPDGLPAKIIGGEVMMTGESGLLVTVWKDADKAKKPSDLRVYTLQGTTLQFTTPYKVTYRKLKGNKAGKIAEGDLGAVIAVRETCITFSNDQVCYSADKHAVDKPVVDQMNESVSQLSRAYAFKAKIDLDGALADIAGIDKRAQCSDKLSTANDVSGIAAISECAATITFAGVTNWQAGDPLGAIRVNTAINMSAYDLQGNKVDTVPVGNYLILNAAPDLTDPGTPGALFLVNGDGKTHFLIPSRVVEGFGDSGDKNSNSYRGQAGIKDARVGGYDL
jgi:hypothetical protein